MGVKSFLQLALSLPIRLGADWVPHGPHVTRYFMYRELRCKLAPHRGATELKVLSISHSRSLVAALELDSAVVVEANYPEHNAISLGAFDDAQFDFVISDQVLEHVEGNPQRVFDESLRLLKPGGIAIHTTCFINPIHGFPSDFWRFTPAALTYLARDFADILVVGGFGNRAIWLVSALGMRTTPVPHTPWHPLHLIATMNNETWPVVTWIATRKGAV